ncbi:ceramide-1-phosphate transfer protein isoform X2 [Petromyzon marinus]|uniref:Ceramide-1-phosphate transfer protein n=2 Tax=Petromyzon marinus TaxID=7757 RepID=A0AAJ7TJM3_PETMA|nr:uncharacterized protein LOC116946950 isoform X1 [Petromyzon marinus]XP_032818131.1 uncharacterized protein LOC116946950 isoform X1 [Petromyzon marinus]
MAGAFARRWGLHLAAAALALYILVIILQRPRGTEYEISKDHESHLEDTPVPVDEALDEPVWPELARPSRATRRHKRPESQVRPPSLCGPGSSWVHCFQPIRLQWPEAHGRQATAAAPREAPPGGLHLDPDEEARGSRRRGRGGEGAGLGGDRGGEGARGGEHESRDGGHPPGRGELARQGIGGGGESVRPGGGRGEEGKGDEEGRRGGGGRGDEEGAMATECKGGGQEEVFCLRDVLDAFRLCLDERGEVLLEEYAQGWRGLIKFMNSLGTMFSFISSDAVSKLDILEAYRTGPHADRYRSLQTMARFELEAGDLVAASRRVPPSGCRTFLRLHRALLWLRLFLERLRTSGENDRPSTMCSEAYDRSLSEHHPWIVRQASSVAFRLLPTRSAFFEVMHVGAEEQVVAMLGEAVPAIEKVYDVSQAVYTEHNMLDLP